MSDSLVMRCLDAWIPGGKQLAATTVMDGHYKRELFFYQVDDIFYLELYETMAKTQKQLMFLYPQELQKIVEVAQKLLPKTPTPVGKK